MKGGLVGKTKLNQKYILNLNIASAYIQLIDQLTIKNPSWTKNILVYFHYLPVVIIMSNSEESDKLLSKNFGVYSSPKDFLIRSTTLSGIEFFICTWV
jgi:hypothetical protein